MKNIILENVNLQKRLDKYFSFTKLQKYIVFEVIESDNFWISDEITCKIKDTDQSETYNLISMVSLVNNHFVTYARCNENWYVCDPMRQGSTIFKMNNVNNDKVSEIYSTKFVETDKTSVYDYINIKERCYFIYFS